MPSRTPKVVGAAVILLAALLAVTYSMLGLRAVAESGVPRALAVESEWDRLWWIDKTARLLRAGEGLGPSDDVARLKSLSDEQIVRHFMADRRFADTVLDFNLYFLGFKSDSLKLDGIYDRAVFGFSNAIASTQELLRDGDYLKLFDFTGPFFMAPLVSERHEESPDPSDKGLDAAQLRTKVVVELEDQFLKLIATAKTRPAPEAYCEEVGDFAEKEAEHIERVHRAFEDAEIFVLIRGRVLSYPFDVLGEAVDAACENKTPDLSSVEALAVALERSRALIERAFDEIATFEPERYEPEAIADFRPFDFAAFPAPVTWPAFGYEQGLALGNSSTNFNRKRAAYVLKRYLCDDLVPLGVEEPQKHATDVHGAQMSCYACHNRLDPMAGFFRNYGAFFYDYSKDPSVIFDDLAATDRSAYEAHWKDESGGKRAWNVGLVRSPRWDEHNSYGETLSDLSRIVRMAPEAKRCLMRRLIEYAVAEDQSIDSGYLDSLTAQFTREAETNASSAFKNAFVRVLQSKAFRQRDADPARCYDFAGAAATPGGPPCRVAALLERNCGQCHGGDREKAAGLDLTSWIESGESRGGAFRHVTKDGKQVSPRETLTRMSDRISANDPARRMPLGKVMSGQERQELFVWLQDELSRTGKEQVR